ncbi:MAG: hypothetical protein JW820_04210 [Spirochaetales bacterium]|nr:hypothetical protein [Spirochaetales bacterium]
MAPDRQPAGAALEQLFETVQVTLPASSWPGYPGHKRIDYTGAYPVDVGAILTVE